MQKMKALVRSSSVDRIAATRDLGIFLQNANWWEGGALFKVANVPFINTTQIIIDDRKYCFYVCIYV